MPFPRTIKPRSVSPFRMPTGLASFGHTGKAQLRAIAAVGRQWDEEFPPMKVGTQPVDAFLAFIEDAWNRKLTFTIEHLPSAGSGHQPYGVGGGVPLVKGAGQTGITLLTDGWTPGVADVSRAGDVLTVAGLPYMLRSMADVDSDGSGEALLYISPAIYVGSSPADNAAITRTSCTLTAFIAAPPVLPPTPPGHYLAGLTLTFQEVA